MEETCVFIAELFEEYDEITCCVVTKYKHTAIEFIYKVKCNLGIDKKKEFSFRKHTIYTTENSFVRGFSGNVLYLFIDPSPDTINRQVLPLLSCESFIVLVSLEKHYIEYVCSDTKLTREFELLQKCASFTNELGRGVIRRVYHSKHSSNHIRDTCCLP